MESFLKDFLLTLNFIRAKLPYNSQTMLFCGI
jgi:hypothetical protein